MKVRDLMTERVYSLQSNDDLIAARDLMWEHGIRHVPIVDEDLELVGLVSERDLAGARAPVEAAMPLANATESLQQRTTGEIMTRDVFTVEAEDDVRQAAQVMYENKYGCLPVISGRKLIGVITEADFVRLMAEGD